MHKAKLSIVALVCIALVCAFSATSAHAAANRTFVSGLGNDANPCTITQPCRTLQAAFNATAPSGEIDVLDPTGYGALIITHGVSIQGHGWASMNVGVVNGTVITVNAPAGDKIVLRGLILEGFGIAGSAITFNTGGTLDIEGSVIRNFVQTAVTFVTPSSSVHTRLFIAHTQIAANAAGISVSALGTAPTTIVLDNVSFEQNAGDGFVCAIGQTTIRNSLFVDNGSRAIVAGEFCGVILTRSIITSNGTGLAVEGTGKIFSFGDNSVAGNTVDGTSTLVIAPK